ncbi:hypothetical protein D3C87_1512580 [compost metagenome]|jgi:hypothetical protein|uniref:hypothetical protein n=1 Tax=unclassified Cupriavidus TaxID=2640874 RepID=UPI000F989C4B|nr:hypothetical protein [Cupriavidus sp.]
MGVIAMAGAVFYFWKFVSQRAAVMLMAFLAFGFLAYWNNDSGRRCDGKTWFCDLVPDSVKAVAVPLEKPEPCPEEEPITARVFQSDAANAELQRLIQAGVCQQNAIGRIARGWRAPYDSEYESLIRK